MSRAFIASPVSIFRHNLLLIAWILVLLGIIRCSVESLVSMRSLLWRRSSGQLRFLDTTTSTTAFTTFLVRENSFARPYSRAFVAAAQPVSSQHSAQSYFERHSRLFSTSPTSSTGSESITSHDNMMSEGGETLTSGSTVRNYSDYEKWVRRLYMTNLFHPVKMGLTNMQQLHDIMGNPMDDVSSTYLAKANVVCCESTSPFPQS